MADVTSIATSALTAYSMRQNVTANNIANVATDNFKAAAVQFQEQKSGGVKGQVITGNDSVDISQEATALLQNSQDFKANLTTLKVADDMTKELLNIKA
jgi:flagellar basal-body rod protein FlgC